MCPDVPLAAALGEVSAALKPPRDPLTHSPPKIARLKKKQTLELCVLEASALGRVVGHGSSSSSGGV